MSEFSRNLRSRVASRVDEAAAALLFARRWLKSPMQVGAVAPSGPDLCRAMVRALAIRPGEHVVELGPGTGAFTVALLAAGVQPERLVLIERDPVFVTHLERRFPGVRVIRGDAGALPEVLAGAGIGPVGHILSGLPLRSMPQPVRRRITAAIGAALKPHGTAVQFTYFSLPPLPPRSAHGAGLEGRRVGFVARNLPPAFVWRYERLARPAGSA